jgi:hypothetical protein
LHLDVGRTLSARNRIHASILLTKRLEGGNEASSLLLAAQSLRNHKKLKGNCKFWEKDVLERARSRRGVRQYAHLAAQPDAQLNLSTLEGLLSAAARGFFVWPGAGCNTMRLGAHPDSCRGGCMRRASALSYIFTYNECVDELNARLMRRMVGTSMELDTLTLTHQPIGSGSARWSTEIVDTRQTLHKRAASPSTTRPLFTHPNGSVCEPARDWQRCRACRGSQLERSCTIRDRQRWCTLSPASRAMKRTDAKCGGWGSTHSSGGVVRAVQALAGEQFL